VGVPELRKSKSFRINQDGQKETSPDSMRFGTLTGMQFMNNSHDESGGGGGSTSRRRSI
jgi:hypothetical protein